MNLRELIRLSLQRIGSNPLRSALTMLGVIIGVASVVAVVSIGQGTGRRITTSIGSLGTNLLTINAGRSFNGLARGAAGSATTLTLGDATEVAALADIEKVAPSVSSQQLVASGIQNETVSVVGTTPEYLSVHADQVWQGSFLTQPSQDLALRVAVIGSTTATNLKLGPANLGQSITIGGLPYRLIGILQPKGGVGSTDDMVIVPLSTLQHRISSSASLSSISVSMVDGADSTVTTNLITAVLRVRHRLAATATADFSVTTQAQLLSVASTVSNTLTLLLVGIGSISLVVGGIGIMNIMLVSVRERTREIGIRKAIGARRRDVLAQFLVEAVVLSLLGGILGIAIGALASLVIGQIAGWGFVFSLPIAAVALVFSALVGIVFGVWPARQAAVLDPIVALRYE
ncbi:MAG: ABC transporter permease [Chloroflexota bacterium]|nr:ABC transporter permease [Chloroflexota bacterium]